MSNKSNITIFSVLKAAQAREHGSRLQKITIYTNGYAEPGYSDPESGFIAVGNWNDETKYDPATRESTVISNLPSRLCAIFEKRFGARKRGLQDATLKLGQLSGDGVKVASIQSDGTAKVRLVSREDFIEGRAL